MLVFFWGGVIRRRKDGIVWKTASPSSFTFTKRFFIVSSNNNNNNNNGFCIHVQNERSREDAHVSDLSSISIFFRVML